MSIQHTHDSTPFLSKIHPLTLICDQVASPANIGGLFRLADAFGVEQLFFSSEIDLSSTRLRKTARGTENRVNYESNSELIEVITNLKENGYLVIGLEITSDSVTIEDFIEAQKAAIERKMLKIALVVGNEKHGISNTVLSLLNSNIHISMYGNNSSMNVTQATAIALYALIRLYKNS